MLSKFSFRQKRARSPKNRPCLSQMKEQLTIEYRTEEQMKQIQQFIQEMNTSTISTSTGTTISMNKRSEQMEELSQLTTGLNLIVLKEKEIVDINK